MYAPPTSWICRADTNDVCDQPAPMTAVASNGTLTVQDYSVSADAPIDCFYVYPTISVDDTYNSDMSAFRARCGHISGAALQPGLQSLRACISVGDIGWSGGQGRSTARRGVATGLRRRARCLASLFGQRQPGPPSRITEPLARHHRRRRAELGPTHGGSQHRSAIPDRSGALTDRCISRRTIAQKTITQKTIVRSTIARSRAAGSASWRPRSGSNARPTGSKPVALSTELRRQCISNVVCNET